MNFKGKGRPLSKKGMEQVCEILGVPEPVVWAILDVETSGFGFLRDKRPKILFERHIFHKLTKGEHDSGNANISSEKPGGYVGGPGEYNRLKEAMRLNREAALKSTSWGIGQIMGLNYEAAGFATIYDMVKAMVKDEDSQLLAMANFIKSKSLKDALQRRDWESFARCYNGPQYKKNKYDKRLAAAYAKYNVMLPDLEVRTAQVALLYLGIDPGTIDGVLGPLTRSALMEFQERFGLPVTGKLDQATKSRLLEKAFPDDEGGQDR